MSKRYSTGFRNVGMVVELKPTGRVGDSMTLNVHCRIGTKRFTKAEQVKLGDSFENNLRHALHAGSEAVVELAKKGAPEAFTSE